MYDIVCIIKKYPLFHNDLLFVVNFIKFNNNEDVRKGGTS